MLKKYMKKVNREAEIKFNLIQTHMKNIHSNMLHGGHRSVNIQPAKMVTLYMNVCKNIRGESS